MCGVCVWTDDVLGYFAEANLGIRRLISVSFPPPE